MTQYGVVLFHTTSAVMKAEKLASKEGYPVNPIPMPRQFSSDCGIALRFNWEHQDDLKLILDKAGVEYNSINFLDTK